MFYTVYMSKGKLINLLFKTNRYALLVMWLLFFVFFSSSKSYAITFIANNSVIEASITNKIIRNIYTLQKIYWENGSKIKVYTFEDNHPLHQQFSKQVTHTFPHQYRRIWDRLRFSGTGVAPTTVYSIEEMFTKVSKTKNSVGYVDKIIDTPNLQELKLTGQSK